MAQTPRVDQHLDYYDVRIPQGVRPGDRMTFGLPDGRVETMVVPAGAHPGTNVQVGVMRKEAGVLDKLATGAKSTLAQVQKKAKDEQWERKARHLAQTAVSTSVSVGSKFVAGFKQGLAGDSTGASQGPAGARREGLPPGATGSALPPPPPPPYVPRSVVAIVPAGLGPGAEMLVATPEGTRQVRVPPGHGPGSQLEVPY